MEKTKVVSDYFGTIFAIQFTITNFTITNYLNFYAQLMLIYSKSNRISLSTHSKFILNHLVHTVYGYMSASFILSDIINRVQSGKTSYRKPLIIFFITRRLWMYK